MVDFADYRPRLVDRRLGDLLAEFPEVMINGEGATGKATTARQHVPAALLLGVPGVPRGSNSLVRHRRVPCSDGGRTRGPRTWTRCLNRGCITTKEDKWRHRWTPAPSPNAPPDGLYGHRPGGTTAGLRHHRRPFV